MFTSVRISLLVLVVSLMVLMLCLYLLLQSILQFSSKFLLEITDYFSVLISVSFKIISSVDFCFLLLQLEKSITSELPRLSLQRIIARIPWDAPRSLETNVYSTVILQGYFADMFWPELFYGVLYAFNFLGTSQISVYLYSIELSNCCYFFNPLLIVTFCFMYFVSLWFSASIFIISIFS